MYTLDIESLPEHKLTRQEKKVLRPSKRLGLVRLGDIIPEVMADLKARCERRRERHDRD